MIRIIWLDSIANPTAMLGTSREARQGALPRIVRRAMMYMMLLVSAGLGCASDTTGPIPVDATHLYYSLQLNHHAITLALTPPYNTLQLTATPVSAAGTSIVDSGVTTWTTSDSSSVQVSSTGVLTARAPVTSVVMTVSHTIGKVTNSTSAVVNVNDVATIPSFARLTLQALPTQSDTVNYELGQGASFVPNALDPAGNPISNVVFWVTSATPLLLDNSNGPLTLSRFGFFIFAVYAPGHVVMVAEATVYGVHKVDTLQFTVDWPQFSVVGVRFQTPVGSLTPVGQFVPTEDTVSAGGTVIWQNGQAPIDVVFDNAAAAQAVDSATFLDGFGLSFHLVIPTQGGGNIPAFGGLDTVAVIDDTTAQTVPAARARRFLTVGTYRYHSVRYGTSGVIHVVP